MKHIGIIKDIRVSPGYDSSVINENKLVTIKANEGGLFYKAKKAGDEVKKDEIIGRIIDPYDGKDLEFITSPTDGIVFFAQNNPLSLQGAPLFKIYCE